MKRYFACALLAASLLAGCGTTPALSTQPGTTVKASATEAAGKVQIYNAFQRVQGNNQLRLVVMYYVRGENQQRQFRQVIVDTVATADRATYKTGYQPTHMVVNGTDLQNNTLALRKVVDELGSLAYHTTTKDHQRIVALAYDVLLDRLQ